MNGYTSVEYSYSWVIIGIIFVATLLLTLLAAIALIPAILTVAIIKLIGANIPFWVIEIVWVIIAFVVINVINKEPKKV